MRDLPRAVEFYRDTLSLSHLGTWGDFAAFDGGGVRIGLHLTPHAAAEGTTLCLACNSLNELEQKLTAADVAFNPDHHATPRGLVMDFHDPDGNPLQAIQLA